MAPTSYSASAPGTLMLMGEHAVLHQKRAIVLAIDKRIRVTLTPRSDQQIHMTSTVGQLQVELRDLTLQKPFQFVIAAILQLKASLTQGFELSIVSEFSSEIGFGSSAAVTVATLAVLYQFIQGSPEISGEPFQEKLFKTARSVIQVVQGMGSGADVAASVFGGIIVYQQASPSILKKINAPLPMVVRYSGSKTPTPQVVQKVSERYKKYPAIFEALYEVMERSIDPTTAAIEQENWQTLGEVITIQQHLMNALGVGTTALTHLVDTLTAESTIFGAKISGAGLGDCVIGIGTSTATSIPVALSLSGVDCG